MRLTKQTNYAIRILMYCATNEGQLSRIQDIAKAYIVSEAFLFKILKSLVKAGFIETVRGRYGGIHLAKSAEEISLLDVVRIAEENFAMAECFDPDYDVCPLIESCALNSALREALGAFFDVLSSYSITKLVENRPVMTSLLGMSDPEHAAPIRTAKRRLMTVAPCGEEGAAHE